MRKLINMVLDRLSIEMSGIFLKNQYIQNLTIELCFKQHFKSLDINVYGKFTILNLFKIKRCKKSQIIIIFMTVLLHVAILRNYVLTEYPEIV